MCFKNTNGNYLTYDISTKADTCSGSWTYDNYRVNTSSSSCKNFTIKKEYTSTDDYIREGDNFTLTTSDGKIETAYPSECINYGVVYFNTSSGGGSSGWLSMSVN